MKLSDNIKIIRKENNLSQEQLAEKLGVSRQAVSKWESGQSYPEMDKVLLICNLFNYNIDELMNENIKEVSETKQYKNNINKYIDDFFGFITKTVEMLSSMKFKEKVKCLIEQCITTIILVCIFAIIGAIGSRIFIGLFGINSFSNTIRSALGSIYIILALIIGIAILLHIFKIRYLDYYEIVKEDDIKEYDEKIEESNNTETPKIFIGQKKEKIIIRDPEHSQSKFLTGIIKAVLWCINIMTIFVAIIFAFSFVGLVTLLVLSFLFIKTGMVFLGALLGIISALVINFVILQILYNSIANKKNHKTIIAILLISSLVLAGLSIGIVLVGITKFNVVEDTSTDIEDVYNMQMTDNLSIRGWNRSIKYVETDSNEVKIVVKHSKYYKTDIDNHNEELYVFCYQDNLKSMDLIRDFIDTINNKEIKNYSYSPTITVYTSKDNIEKIKQNKESRYENESIEIQEIILE